MCYKHALVQAVSETSEAKVENGDALIENVEDLSLHCLNEHVLFWGMPVYPLLLVKLLEVQE